MTCQAKGVVFGIRRPGLSKYSADNSRWPGAFPDRSESPKRMITGVLPRNTLFAGGTTHRFTRSPTAWTPAASRDVLMRGEDTMRLINAAACGAAIAALSVTAVALPQAANASSVPARSGQLSSASRPFRIKAGEIYTVHDGVRGVRGGDRLALESRYHHRWHLIGSWKLHSGQRHFRGRARTSQPGLYTLRLQFLRHHRLLKGSESNRFRVRVLGFHVPRLRRPRARSVASLTPGLARPGTVAPSWTSIRCGQAFPYLGHGVFIPSPLGSIPGTGEVAQVVWARDALPGGHYGGWYVASVNPQYITPPQPDIITIGADGSANSSDLTPQALRYPTQTEYHQVAWDLAVQGSDGSWSWGSNTWFTPASYVQYAQNERDTFQSANCLTYLAGGRSG